MRINEQQYGRKINHQLANANQKLKLQSDVKKIKLIFTSYLAIAIINLAKIFNTQFELTNKLQYTCS